MFASLLLLLWHSFRLHTSTYLAKLMALGWSLLYLHQDIPSQTNLMQVFLKSKSYRAPSWWHQTGRDQQSKDIDLLQKGIHMSTTCSHDAAVSLGRATACEAWPLGKQNRIAKKEVIQPTSPAVLSKHTKLKSRDTRDSRHAGRPATVWHMLLLLRRRRRQLEGAYSANQFLNLIKEIRS